MRSAHNLLPSADDRCRCPNNQRMHTGRTRIQMMEDESDELTMAKAMTLRATSGRQGVEEREAGRDSKSQRRM
ncbi:hypothetical protein E3N88_12500 [Mikania micrantha]|uniref:Uncharacterized protein n=1 Tax=Mikania micrantha TaxID=192012 RepID=A0A5N6P5P9_9ASTR|nr:hypothetical protein E3N88_12500 [Mikania micrantha]